MMTKKIWIHFPFQNGPGGGGASFLYNLMNYWKEQNLLADDPISASVILFNGHHDLAPLFALKKINPKAFFVHRVDGPMALYNGPQDLRDEMVRVGAQFIADAYVFQSVWSKQKCQDMGIVIDLPEVVIGNAADEKIFKPKEESTYQPGNKLKLIASGWSTNPNKGLSTLKWLDDNLDWSKYQMSYIGNNSLPFSNITHLEVQGREALAQNLKAADVYIFPSRFEACSNALIEAQTVGLVTLAYGASSNPEYVSHPDLLFTADEQIPTLLEKVKNNYQTYFENTKTASLEQVAKRYQDFFQELLKEGTPKASFDSLRLTRAKILLNEIKLLSKIPGGFRWLRARKDLLGKDSSLNTISGLIQAASNLLITVAMARILPKEEVGIYAYFFSIQGLLSLATLPGHDTMINKAALLGQHSFIFKALKKIFFCATSVALLGGLLLALNMKLIFFQLEHINVIFWALLSLPILGLEKIEQALLGLNSFSKLANYRFIFSFFFVLLMGAVLTFAPSVNGAIASYLVARLIQGLYGLWVLKVKGSNTFSCKHSSSKLLLCLQEKVLDPSTRELDLQAKKLTLYNALNTIASNLQPFILFHLSPVRLANFYNGSKIPEKIKDYAKFILIAPVQKWMSKGAKHFEDQLSFYALSYLATSFLFAIVLAIICHFAIPAIFGADYKEAIIVAQLLCFTIPPKLAANVLQQRELVFEDTVFYRRSGHALTALSLLIMYPLIKTWAEIGLCLNGLIVSYVGFALSFFNYRKKVLRK